MLDSTSPKSRAEGDGHWTLRIAAELEQQAAAIQPADVLVVCTIQEEQQCALGDYHRRHADRQSKRERSFASVARGWRAVNRRVHQVNFSDLCELEPSTNNAPMSLVARFNPSCTLQATDNGVEWREALFPVSADVRPPPRAKTGRRGHAARRIDGQRTERFNGQNDIDEVDGDSLLAGLLVCLDTELGELVIIAIAGLRAIQCHARKFSMILNVNTVVGLPVATSSDCAALCSSDFSDSFNKMTLNKIQLHSC